VLSRPLSDRQRRLLSEERGVLGALRVDLERLSASGEDTRSLEVALEQLDEPFLLVVVGEFNSGKSSFINALLGEALLEEGVTPTTQRLQLIAHADAELPRSARELHVERARVEWLREVHLVDTPGTNAIEREHELLTRRFVPRADMVLFVTSADRPFTESERAFLASIREWGKKVAVVVNKIDILETEQEVVRVLDFVRQGVVSLLGFEPEVWPVSSRSALRAKLQGDGGDALERSRLPELEVAVRERLQDDERVRLKLLNPIGVASRLVESYAESVASALALLAEDVGAVDAVESDLDGYRQDLRHDFGFRMADIDNALHEFERRGNRFFDETLRFGRVLDLLNRDRIKAEFEREAVGDVPQQVERRVLEIVDWLVEADLKQWQAISERLEERRIKHGDRVVGRVARALEDDRGRLLATVGRAARATVDGYDREAEASRLAESVRAAVTGAALLGAGALGVGTVVTLLASTTAADVTGLVAASTMAVVGLLVIPTRRKRAKRELAERIADLRRRLSEAITGQFERELERDVQRMREAIAPYSRFVRRERERLDGLGESLRWHAERLAALRLEIEGL
jgi:GTP-binding protein EngB required for normal cell division